MKQFRYSIFIGILFVLITGTLSHFLYEWTDRNPIIGLFTPVNESTWEHMKLLFFPMLLYSLILIFKFKDHYPCIASAAFSGLILGTSLIPVFFYSYTYIMGHDIFLIDIAIFIISVLIAFWTVYKLALSCKAQSYTFFLCVIVCLYIACFLWFTYNPPNLELFAQPVVSRM